MPGQPLGIELVSGIMSMHYLGLRCVSGRSPQWRCEPSHLTLPTSTQTHTGMYTRELGPLEPLHQQNGATMRPSHPPPPVVKAMTPPHLWEPGDSGPRRPKGAGADVARLLRRLCNRRVDDVRSRHRDAHDVIAGVPRRRDAEALQLAGAARGGRDDQVATRRLEGRRCCGSTKARLGLAQERSIHAFQA